MKFETTASFDRDFKGLPEGHRETFKKFAPRFHDAAVKAAAGEDKPWPRGMRVKTVQGSEGIWETTWSKDHPDGRVTWEWIGIDGAAAIRWRRVGDHSVLGNP